MTYDAFATTFSRSRKNLRWEEIEYFVDFIIRHYPDKKVSILDVGCGNGRFLDTLSQSILPYSYHGIDASVGMVNEAKMLHPDMKFTVLDMIYLEDLPDNETYDVIIFIASFHHIDNEYNRKKVLKSTKSLLNPGGIIMMTHWNLMGEANFMKYQSGYKGNGDFGIKIGTFERYYHGFSLPELEELFIESGYDLLENRIFEEGKNIISIIQPRPNSAT